VVVDADAELTRLPQLCRRVTDPGFTTSFVVNACIAPKPTGQSNFGAPGQFNIGADSHLNDSVAGPIALGFRMSKS
jgi:hypothetical protein